MLAPVRFCSEPGILEFESGSFIVPPTRRAGRQPDAAVSAGLDEAAHAGEQLIFAEWLGHVEIGALLQSPPFVERSVFGAYQDDGNIAALLHLFQFAAELKAVLFG